MKLFSKLVTIQRDYREDLQKIEAEISRVGREDGRYSDLWGKQVGHMVVVAGIQDVLDGVDIHLTLQDRIADTIVALDHLASKNQMEKVDHPDSSQQDIDRAKIRIEIYRDASKKLRKLLEEGNTYASHTA